MSDLKSIRVNGVRVDELPIAERHEAKAQLRLAEDEDRKQRIKEILAKYPPYQVSALEAQIRMSKDSIARANQVIVTENQTISDYRAHIAVCEHRDRELRRCGVELSRK